MPAQRTHLTLAVVLVLCTIAIVLTTPERAMAQASPFTQVTTSPFGPIVVVSTCTGEAVTVQGTQRSLIHATFDANGGGHFRFFTGQNGFGIGATTGNQYKFMNTSGTEADFSGSGSAFTMQIDSRGNQYFHGSVSGAISDFLCRNEPLVLIDD